MDAGYTKCACFEYEYFCNFKPPCPADFRRLDLKRPWQKIMHPGLGLSRVCCRRGHCYITPFGRALLKGVHMKKVVGHLRFFFDYGAGGCLWAGDVQTTEALG